jgi:hypothetical protein
MIAAMSEDLQLRGAVPMTGRMMRRSSPMSATAATNDEQ